MKKDIMKFYADMFKRQMIRHEEGIKETKEKLPSIYTFNDTMSYASTTEALIEHSVYFNIFRNLTNIFDNFSNDGIEAVLERIKNFQTRLLEESQTDLRYASPMTTAFKVNAITTVNMFVKFELKKYIDDFEEEIKNQKKENNK